MTKAPEHMTLDELDAELREMFPLLATPIAPRQRRRLILTVNGRTPAQLYRSAGAILGKPKRKA